MAKRERRKFTEEFKNQMVQLYLNGKSRQEIIREYDLTPSSLDKWVGQMIVLNLYHSRNYLIITS
ncbi:transposase IS3/IS911 [Bacillus sp. 1NLA3E]|nr:transposase IS3/IS911 [Bacillus sp. 1NLA3E]